jgi:hypothetical protein
MNARLSRLAHARWRLDTAAVVVLIALWALFFWRLFTPVAADRVSLREGDFTGQFVAFAAYQHARFAAGEVPLWNPHNNGGFPFVGDTQAAVFYPPRLITIALVGPGGWSYRALELEMTAHVLAFTLAIYLLVRRMTRTSASRPWSVTAGLAAALTGGYGGFMTGYAPLQLAILEAAAWTPLAVLGLHEAANHAKDTRAAGLVLAGVALGMAWLAGHPQTGYLLTGLLIAYWAYRAWAADAPWRVRAARFVGGAAVFGAVALGIAAALLVPGIEYLLRTARVGLGYDAKGNGFPIHDVVQFVVPGVVSLFSPLYAGVFGLLLAGVAVFRRAREAWFWAGTAVFALVWSFGANTALFAVLYNVLPGLRFFRGQERGAFLVAFSAAVLAGLGAAALLTWAAGASGRDYLAALRLRMALRRLVLAVGAVSALVFAAWLGNTAALGPAVSRFAFASLLCAVAAALFPAITLRPPERRTGLAMLLVGLIAFDLFSVTMSHPATYETRPPGESFTHEPPPLVAAALADLAPGARVDGARGLLDNFGSFYRVDDMRGISPLFLSDMSRLIEGDASDAAAWELLAVSHIFSDWEQLPVPARVIASGADRYGPVRLHRLEDPRPFAHFVERAAAHDSSAVFAILRDPVAAGVNLRTTALVGPGDAALAGRTFSPGTAEVIGFAPEQIRIAVSVAGADDGLLSLSLVTYPGWEARIDGEPVGIVQAYNTLSAVVVPPGQHTVTLVYNPLSAWAGLAISLSTGAAALAFTAAWAARARSFRKRNERSA